MGRRLPLWLVVASACSPYTDVSRPEDAPTGSVLSPSEGAVVAAGHIDFLGRVNDTEDPPENLYVVWSIGNGDDGAWTDVCHGFAEAGTGETRCVTTVDVSVTRVRLLVKDVAGFQRVATQSIVVREVVVPTVSIASPIAPGPFYADVPLVLEATVGDDDGGADALSLSWSSDQIGPVDGPTLPDPQGRLRGTIGLPEGSHVLTLTARDADGQVARAETAIHVGAANVAPYVRIDAPTSGAVLALGAPVDLSGVALDSVTPGVSLDVAWSSDLDGELGRSTPGALGAVTLGGVALSAGVHELDLSAVDDAGAQTHATVSVRVDAPPDLALLEPVDGLTLTWPAPLHVDATLSDTVTPSADLRLRVRSSLSGDVLDLAANAEGRVAADVVLALGVHVLTLQARDGYGLVAEATRTVTVTSP